MAEGLTVEEREQREGALRELIEMMRPAVQQDGGDLVLLDANYETGVIDVMLEGACSSCAISASTLQLGVERILTSRLDWVSEVRGGVDTSIDADESASLGRGAYVPRF